MKNEERPLSGGQEELKSSLPHSEIGQKLSPEVQLKSEIGREIDLTVDPSAFRARLKSKIGQHPKLDELVEWYSKFDKDHYVLDQLLTIYEGWDDDYDPEDLRVSAFPNWRKDQFYRLLSELGIENHQRKLTLGDLMYLAKEDIGSVEDLPSGQVINLENALERWRRAA